MNSITANKRLARVIYIASYAAALAVAWQAVRFCQGHIGAPGVDQFFALLQGIFGTQATADEVASSLGGLVVFFGWINKALYYLGGIFVWLMFAQVVRSAGWTLGRIVEVGFDQYRAEVKEAERLAAIEDARDRRREARLDARRRATEAEQPKSGFSLTTLAIGIMIGKLL